MVALTLTLYAVLGASPVTATPVLVPVSATPGVKSFHVQLELRQYSTSYPVGIAFPVVAPADQLTSIATCVVLADALPDGVAGATIADGVASLVLLQLEE